MRRFTIITVALSVALLFALALPAAASSRHPFHGNWKGTDIFDESNVTLWIVEETHSGGQVFEIRGHDDHTGEWCGGPARMEAIGVLEEETSMAVSKTWWCLPAGSNILYFLEDSLTYNPSADTITDSEGSIYHRTP